MTDKDFGLLREQVFSKARQINHMRFDGVSQNDIIARLDLLVSRAYLRCIFKNNKDIFPNTKIFGGSKIRSNKIKISKDWNKGKPVESIIKKHKLPQISTKQFVDVTKRMRKNFHYRPEFNTISVEELRSLKEEGRSYSFCADYFYSDLEDVSYAAWSNNVIFPTELRF